MKTEPIKALEELKHCAWTAEDFNISDGFESHKVVDKNDAINISNIAFREGQSNPKTKQLEWEEYNNEWEADAPFGTYRIEITGDQFKIYLIGGLISRRNSLEEAKQAAQEHFEKKVMECLE